MARSHWFYVIDDPGDEMEDAELFNILGNGFQKVIYQRVLGIERGGN